MSILLGVWCLDGASFLQSFQLNFLYENNVFMELACLNSMRIQLYEEELYQEPEIKYTRATFLPRGTCYYDNTWGGVDNLSICLGFGYSEPLEPWCQKQQPTGDKASNVFPKLSGMTRQQLLVQGFFESFD